MEGGSGAARATGGSEPAPDTTGLCTSSVTYVQIKPHADYSPIPTDLGPHTPTGQLSSPYPQLTFCITSYSQLSTSH